MADRYYIGARYVPAVYEGPDGSNTWLPGVDYDGLVIVTYGNYSYMSKKPVPAGMDPPDINPAYWIKAAVYNADVNNVVEQLDQKADKDGVYPDLFAGNLISDTMHTDNAPYLERETAGGLSGIAPLCYPTLVGASVAENQLCNGESVTIPNGRKYYLKKSGTESLGASTGTAITGLTSGSDMVIDLTQMLGSTIADYIYTLEQAIAGSGIAWLRSHGFLNGYQAYNSGSIESVDVTEKKVVGFNQWDEEWEVGIFNYNDGTPLTSSNQIRSKNYTAVVPNTTYYIKAPGSVLILGYDKGKNFLRRLRYNTGNATFVTRTTDGDDCYFIKFCTIDSPTYGSTYNHDICINLSSTNRNGEYEPYKSITYPLGSDTLRGIFKLDANNRLYADGDHKEADGTITRRYGVVDLGTLTWNYIGVGGEHARFTATLNVKQGSAIITSDKLTPTNDYNVVYNHTTDNVIIVHPAASQLEAYSSAYTIGTDFATYLSGVMMVYELQTPTTEQSTPFTSPQLVYPDGTEEFVTENNGVPVGHETGYPYDLKGVIEKLVEVPAADGTYTLKATRSGANITYTWDQEV